MCLNKQTLTNFSQLTSESLEALVKSEQYQHYKLNLDFGLIKPKEIRVLKGILELDPKPEIEHITIKLHDFNYRWVSDAFKLIMESGILSEKQDFHDYLTIVPVSDSNPIEEFGDELEYLSNCVPNLHTKHGFGKADVQNYKGEAIEVTQKVHKLVVKWSESINDPKLIFNEINADEDLSSKASPKKAIHKIGTGEEQIDSVKCIEIVNKNSAKFWYPLHIPSNVKMIFKANNSMKPDTGQFAIKSKECVILWSSSCGILDFAGDEEFTKVKKNTRSEKVLRKKVIEESKYESEYGMLDDQFKLMKWKDFRFEKFGQKVNYEIFEDYIIIFTPHKNVSFEYLGFVHKQKVSVKFVNFHS